MTTVDMSLPGISVITVTLDCAQKLKECFRRLAAQDYPKEKIEVIVLDGGSKDSTKNVALEFGARFIEAGYRDNQEARRSLGIQYASNELLLFLDSDNYLPDCSWLRQMVEPLKDPGIIAAQPLRYLYDPQETLMNRYFALMGVNDPVAFYLGKADRLSYLYDVWNLNGEILEENDHYYKIIFEEKNLPTIGSNGFLVRKHVLQVLGLASEAFFHIDVHVDLIRKGLDTYAVVKNSIFHSTGETFIKSMAKRVRYMKKHCGQLKSLRRYKVFDNSRAADRMNLFKFIFFSLTFLEPLWVSFKGFRKVKDPAWFVHPLVCWGFVMAYGSSAIISLFALTRRKV